MEAPPARTRLYLTLASVAIAVFLFACGAREESGSSGEEAPGVGASPSPGDAGADAGTPETGSPAPRSPAFPIPDVLPAGGPSQQTAPSGPRPSSPAPRRDAQGHRVFTNEDLEAFRSTATPPSRPTGRRLDVVDVTGAGAPGAAQAGEGPDSPGAPGPADAESEIAATREAIARLEEDLASLRSRIPSLHNPFLPRVQPADADREAEQGMDNAQRLQHVNGRIAEGEARLAELRRKLEDLTRAAASQESGGAERP